MAVAMRTLALNASRLAVLRAVLDEPGADRHRICELTGLAPGTAFLHATALEAGGVLRADREGALRRGRAGIHYTVDTHALRGQLAEFMAYLAER
jgi:DNA-binding transcriptional ArsR family regulator